MLLKKMCLFKNELQKCKNKLSNHSFSWEICLAILLQSSAALTRWCVKWYMLTLKIWKSPVRSWVTTFFFEPLDIGCNFLSFYWRRPAIFMFLGIALAIRKRLVAHLWPVACTCATLRHLSSCCEGLLKRVWKYWCKPIILLPYKL